jgi:hypothetical protein
MDFDITAPCEAERIGIQFSKKIAETKVSTGENVFALYKNVGINRCLYERSRLDNEKLVSMHVHKLEHRTPVNAMKFSLCS